MGFLVRFFGHQSTPLSAIRPLPAQFALFFPYLPTLIVATFSGNYILFNAAKQTDYIKKCFKQKYVHPPLWSGGKGLQRLTFLKYYNSLE